MCIIEEQILIFLFMLLKVCWLFVFYCQKTSGESRVRKTPAMQEGLEASGAPSLLFHGLEPGGYAVFLVQII